MDKLEKARADAVRKRLEELTTRWPQAEIARRLGTSRTNVSRYLRGTRMPLDVGSAIVTELGVNPAWLLTGEGAPMLSDVSGATEAAAGDLLALVEAMNRVSHMRLGALTGKHHLRVLRELNDALSRFEALRTDLNRRTLPVFKELLEHYEKALRKGQIEQAESLREALSQVQRLCEDPLLDRRFWSWQAYHEQFFGKPELAAEFERRVFRETLPQASLIDERSLFETCNFAYTLLGAGRCREARAVCRAALTMAEEVGIDRPVLDVLRCAIATAGIPLGKLTEELGQFTRSFVALGAEMRMRLHGVHIRNQLLTGLVDYFGGVHLWPGDVHAPEMLRFAMWLEQPTALDHACKHWIGPGVKEAPATIIAGFAGALRDALAGERRAAAKFLDSRVPATPSADVDGLRVCVHATQLARLSGNDRQARAWLKREDDLLSRLSAEVSPDPLVLGTHWRNVRKLKPRSRAQADAFFRDWTALGYGCFAALEPATA